MVNFNVWAHSGNPVYQHVSIGKSKMMYSHAINLVNTRKSAFGISPIIGWLVCETSLNKISDLHVLFHGYFLSFSFSLPLSAHKFLLFMQQKKGSCTFVYHLSNAHIKGNEENGIVEDKVETKMHSILVYFS